MNRTGKQTCLAQTDQSRRVGHGANNAFRCATSGHAVTAHTRGHAQVQACGNMPSNGQGDFFKHLWFDRPDQQALSPGKVQRCVAVNPVGAGLTVRRVGASGSTT
jgi:hypothetical protein